ncbi:MFS transporter [Oceanobacillus sp. APA_J-5(13-2)]|nr:MFS transporter [Oceanobacillus alkalisoli]MCF3943412.1 MFS transporter [Oceanobacillus alkalisoli]MCG5104001.1 MFS transporter [Oceanobacillus alkalisoli]
MPKVIWLLVIATTINVTGGSFLWPMNTIYMHNELGQSLAFAGFILMLNQGAAVIGNLIGGALYDRFSAYYSILCATGIALIAAITMAFNHSIVPYAILLVVIGFGNGITWPIMFAMAGSLWPDGGRKAFNAVYVAQNLGVALGATLSGYVASFSFDYIFIANALFIALFFLLVLFAFKQLDEAKNRQMHTSIIEQRGKVKNSTTFIALLILCAGFLFIHISYSQWMTTIASYTQDIGIPVEQYSTIWAINGFLIVFAQPLVQWFTNRFTNEKHHIYIGTTIMIVSFLVVMNAQQFTMFAVAMIILTIGEVLMWPAFPTLANKLAPKGREGFYQGLVNSIATVGRMTGPLVGGFIVDYYHIEILFFCLVGLLLIPYITTFLYDKKIKAEQGGL